MIATHVTFHDLPFIASTAAGIAEINENWEAYMIGAAGTQILNQGVGYAGSWAAEGNYFGVHGIEQWNYGIGDAGTKVADDGLGYTGSWAFNEGQLIFAGTDHFVDYIVGATGSQIYGGTTGASTGTLIAGYRYNGTWVIEPDNYAIIANDDWAIYTVGTAGTQVLNAGTGWNLFSGSAWT